jgi:hypothetical protein
LGITNRGASVHQDCRWQVAKKEMKKPYKKLYLFIYPESIQLILFTLKFEISIKSLFTTNFFIINIEILILRIIKLFKAQRQINSINMAITNY